MDRTIGMTHALDFMFGFCGLLPVAPGAERLSGLYSC